MSRLSGGAGSCSYSGSVVARMRVSTLDVCSMRADIGGYFVARWPGQPVAGGAFGGGDIYIYSCTCWYVLTLGACFLTCVGHKSVSSGVLVYVLRHKSRLIKSFPSLLNAQWGK
jgi:hypothetical protein